MLIVFEDNATPDMIREAQREIERLGLKARPAGRDRLSAAGSGQGMEGLLLDRLRSIRGVRDVYAGAVAYRLASREQHPEDTIVAVGDIEFGGDVFPVVAGPCSIESRDQAMTIAETVARAGARMFRGGAFKPRTSPYSFQGLGPKGLRILEEVRSAFGLKIVTEALDIDVLGEVADVADLVQIGSRNMQNFSLLKKAGRINKPILLKRGMAATVDEFLLAAEYVLLEGNSKVVLCERGVRLAANRPGNVLDLASILDVKEQSHLPIIADPSHAAETRIKVGPLSRAALAVGAHGLMVEVHNRPQDALSDGRQAVTPDEFTTLMDELRRLTVALNRKII
jgi:3-deoxy-7-phosphoheptulonate synthase